tara:strand:+ start:566 stop:838 length:273 start_codon:yes stop_codon:yes gene_type:complete
MATKNDITGDKIKSKAITDKYSAGWEALFNKSPVPLGEDNKPKDWVKLGLSPSTIVEDWDVRKNKHLTEGESGWDHPSEVDHRGIKKGKE